MSARVGCVGTEWHHPDNSYETYESTNSYGYEPTSYATFTFQGKMLQLYFAQEDVHGRTAVSLDGGPETTVDLYSKIRRGYQMLWAASNLASGVNHTVKIRATGTKNPKSTASIASIDGAVVSNAVCISEPDSSFCGRLGKNCGAVTGIDNCGAPRSVPFCDSATILGDQLLWTSPTLSSGSHTLKLRVTGNKNGAASDRFVVVDRVSVTASSTCTTESNTDFCSRLAKNTGSVSGTDNCGNSRTVSSCGSCSSDRSCQSGLCTRNDGDGHNDGHDDHHH